MYDIVAFGEGFVRLSPPGRLRLEQTHGFEVYVGGPELTVAAACSRLGLSAAWVSRVPRHPLGRMIVNRAREHGADVSRIVWVDEGRVPLCFLEKGAMPRAGLVVWDDAESALSRVGANEVDWSFLSEARLLHVNAETPALSDGAADATRAALVEARSHGCKVSFHLHCARRAPGAHAATLYESLVQKADLLIADAEDAQDIFGTDDDPAAAARELKDRFDLDAVAIPIDAGSTQRNRVWTGIVAGDDFYTDRTYNIDIVDVGGVVDAFAAGIIHGYLRDDLKMGLQYGNALAAIKHTHPGELCYFTEEEIGEQIEAAGPTIRR
jgi:2-dehydro-3-deoxygluconokinase